MELEQLKAQWAEHDRKLDTSIRLNRQLIREVYTGRTRSALLRLVVILALNAAATLVVVISLGSFIGNHFGMPRFVLPAVLLDAFAIASLAALNLQIALALRTDYDKPIAVIQKRLTTLRTVRIRYIQAIFVTSALIWMPMFIVGMKAFLGVDVYQTFDRAWIVWNVLFGLAVIPLGIWLMRKYGDRMGLAGYNLDAASRFLTTLAEFEEDPSVTA